MNVSTSFAIPRFSATPAPAAPPASSPAAPPAVQKDGVDPLRLAAVIAGPAIGAGAGVYAGLNTGLISEIIGIALIPGAAIGLGILGAVAAEKYRPKWMGEYPAIAGGIYGGLLGGAAGIAQAFLAGSTASPILAATMGLTGAVTGLAFVVGRLTRPEKP